MDRCAVERALKQIEENLTDDEALSNAALARAAGYSEFHFIRMFREAVRLTPADYVRKRRISEIVRAAACGIPFSDAALARGFNSPENFTRAFRKEHGVLPTATRAAGCSLRLFSPFSFDRADPSPAVSLAWLPELSLTVYPFGTDFPPKSWNRYNTERRSARLSGGAVTEDYGVMIRNPAGGLDYFIGIRTEEAAGDVSGTVRLTLKEGMYAVFQTQPAGQHDFVETVQRTWDWIYDVWMPENGFRRGRGYECERYTESSRTFREEILVPIVPERSGQNEPANARGGY